MGKLLKYIKNYKLQAIFAPLFKLLEAIFELIVPLVVAAIVDNGIQGGQGWEYILWMCLLLVGLGVVGLISAVAAQYFAAYAAVGFSKSLRHDLFNKIQSLPYSEIDKMGTGRMITRMTSDVNQIQSTVNMVLRLFMRSPFIVFGAMIMAFTISTMAGAVFALSIVVLSVIVFAIMLISIPLYKKVQTRLDGVTNTTRETLTGVRVIRAFCKEEEEVASYREKNTALTKSQVFVGKLSALMNPLTYAVINAFIILLMYVGAIEVDGGMLSQGKVLALYNYMSQILVELIKLANLIIIITKSFASAGRVNEILEIDTTRKISQDSSKRGEHFIEFRNASVNYNGSEIDALSDVTFTAEHGETIGIIGGTGAGKTTLVNALTHFYDLSSGEILVDGRDISSFDDVELKDRCGIVPQRAVLFKGTIRDNICWGKNDATDEEIKSALKIAQANDVIASKEKGLDEMIEEGGKNFSGGQRQRLTIARALIKNPEILILDDSASALDFATDLKLRKAIRKLPSNPTVFVVSQRTSSIKNADKIIVLDGGKVVGIGTHDELLKSCSVYSEIHFSQYGKVEVAQ